MQGKASILCSLRLKPTKEDERFIKKINNKSIQINHPNGGSYKYGKILCIW